MKSGYTFWEQIPPPQPAHPHGKSTKPTVREKLPLLKAQRYGGYQPCRGEDVHTGWRYGLAQDRPSDLQGIYQEKTDTSAWETNSKRMYLQDM